MLLMIAYYFGVTMTLASVIGLLKLCTCYMTYKSHLGDTYWGSGILHTALCHYDLDLWPQFLKNRIPNISPTLLGLDNILFTVTLVYCDIYIHLTYFEVTIANFMCGCILMLEIEVYYF